MEGALLSAQNALREGWNIGSSFEDPTLGREFSQGHMISNHLELSLFP